MAIVLGVVPTCRRRASESSRDISATRRRQESHASRCLAHRNRRDVVEVPQAISLQDRVGRVDGGVGAHFAISSSKSKCRSSINHYEIKAG